MKHGLDEVLKGIGDAYRERISGRSRIYMEVDIGSEAEKQGHPNLQGPYRGVLAIVPLKREMAGMKVLVDGRSFVDYAQFSSGIVVPGHVARDSGLCHNPYEANESMVLNFV